MPGFIRCRACGYVTAASFSGGICPACGVPRSSFEPYEDRISENRRKWLGLHLHQVVIHFPQAFSVTLLATIILGYYGTGYPVLSVRFLETSRILGIFFPFAVLCGFVSGIIDGRMRFKRLNTPFLRLKIATGVLFLGAAISETLIISCAGFGKDTILPILLLNFLAVGCTVILGFIGEKLTCAAMGGS